MVGPARWRSVCVLAGLAGCFQKLDRNAARGFRSAEESEPSVDQGEPDSAAPPQDSGGSTGSGGRGAGGASGSGGASGADGPAAVDPCVAVDRQARAILEASCAHCHQSPAKMGNFDFCLEVDTLTMAVGSTGKRFIVPGLPDESRLYQRVAAGEMPPPARMPRPSREDVMVLREWIGTCLLTLPHSSSDGGREGRPLADAGVSADGASDDGCGGPGQACCAANQCQRGGCCVLGRCRENGATCGAAGEQEDEEGLPGRCEMGSCVRAGSACGNVAQACCGKTGTCTATQSTCAMGMTCGACGGLEQACCGAAATCVAGLDCQGNGFGRAGLCRPCGAVGQPCCGDGPVANQHCAGLLVCRFVAGVGDRCGL
jgi:hypothetical protein